MELPPVARSRRIVLAAFAALVLPAAAWAEFSGGDPANRLAFSHIEAGRPGATQPLDPGGALLDGDAATRFILRAGEQLAISFIGAPRWVSRLVVDARGSGFTATATTAGNDEVTLASADAQSSGGSRTFEFPGQYLTSVTFTAGTADVSLHDLSATFVSRDPDNAKLGTGDEGTRDYHADYCNDYPGTSDDLSVCDNNAEDLGDKLPGDWTVNAKHGDLGAHEEHLKNSSLGGNNNDHVDGADLSIWCGHGGVGYDDPATGTDLGSMIFGNATADDDNCVPSDAANAWGDSDMEWFDAISCETLREAGQGYWADALAGQHLICGSEDDIHAKNYGTKLGDYYIDNGAFDSAKSIKQAWFDAIDAHNGGHDIAAVIGENSTMGNDYLWGQGSTASDPTVDGTYTCWEYDVGLVGPHHQSAPAPALVDPVTHRAEPGRGWTVTHDRSLLSVATPSQMPVYNVIPRLVDSVYVRMLANTLCSAVQSMCGGDIGPGNPGDLNLIQGNKELRVRTQSGAWHYEDVAKWMAWRNVAPQLLTGEAAISEAEQILTQMGRRPSDAVVEGVHYLKQRASLKGAGGQATADLPESTFAVASQVRYTRRLGSTPVFGAGASLTVSLGAGGGLERIWHGGWRQVQLGQNVVVLPLDSVIVALNTLGNASLVDNIARKVTSVQINSSELGYYEPNCYDSPSTLRPVWCLHCTLFGPGGDSDPADLLLWADVMPVRAHIQSSAGQPAGGASSMTPSVPAGSTVNFTGTADHGVPPYNFTWFREGSVVGNGPSYAGVCDFHNSGDDVDSTVTVRLQVKDALGDIGYALYSLRLDPVTGVTTPEWAAAHGLTLDAATTVRVTAGAHFTLESRDSDAPVTLHLVDATGRAVRTFDASRARRGSASVSWDGRDAAGRPVAAGTYLLRAGAGEVVTTRKLTVVR